VHIPLSNRALFWSQLSNQILAQKPLILPHKVTPQMDAGSSSECVFLLQLSQRPIGPLSCISREF